MISTQPIHPLRAVHASALVALVAGCLLLAACAEGPGDASMVVIHGVTMGTTYSVKVVETQAPAATLQGGIQHLLDRIDGAMSTYRADSDVSRFNRSTSTDWFPVAGPTATVVGESLRISRLTGGAFDVSVGPLVELWGFGPGERRDTLPPEDEVRRRLATVGWRYLHVREEPPAIKKDRPGLHVDLSAIAKGYGVDQIAGYLETRGERNYLVEIGGELRARGHNARHQAWTIAVERPSPGGRGVQAILRMADEGLATSGDYRNFFEQDGRRFSHTIDPRTGRPISHGLASVTVVAPTAMDADALATALMVMGTEGGVRFAEGEGIGAFFISKGPKGWVEKSTASMHGRLTHR